MSESAAVNLKITIEHKNPAYTLDSPPDHTFTFEADMIDSSVHAWLALFANILAYEGFSEEMIMRAGCQLAFDEYRKPEIMRKVAVEYGLKLLEDSGSDD
jgi:hypothetical protein